MAKGRGDYGIDAPIVPILFGLGILAAAAVVGLSLVTGGGAGSVTGPAFALVIFALCLASYLHSSVRGKFQVWEDLLDASSLAADARVLDLGCGRGAVLLAVARRLGPDGHADGIDVWRSVDQSGNALESTMANAEVEGVAHLVGLHTGDLRDLPFADASYDVVVSSLAIHNIKDRPGRDQAALEAMRVLRAGGRMLIVDLPAGKGYLRLLRDRLEDGQLRDVGWRMWWGGPFYRSTALSGTKPAPG